MSSSAPVKIRHMNAADLDRVHGIALSLAEAPHWPVSAYAAAIDSTNTPRRIALVAIDQENDTQAGFLVASLLPPEAELETIAVAAEGQRRGVGVLLLNALTKELRAEKVSKLILEVRASNVPALGFYAVFGFRESGRRPRYYADPEEDAVLMERDLL
jgi:[ribosomal protein S18]-alanine N-acetyltransferase